MNAVSQEADEEFIRKVLKDNLKLTAILEFIISTYTFNIWVELAIIPITTMIVMMNVIAERKEEYEKVHKLLDIVLFCEVGLRCIMPIESSRIIIQNGRSKIGRASCRERVC